MDEKKCIECTYFVEYYTKLKTRFYKTDTGFCNNYKHVRRGSKIDKVCEFYNKRDLKIEKEKRLIYLKDYLAEVAKRLNDLKNLLVEDDC